MEEPDTLSVFSKELYGKAEEILHIKRAVLSVAVGSHILLVSCMIILRRLRWPSAWFNMGAFTGVLIQIAWLCKAFLNAGVFYILVY